MRRSDSPSREVPDWQTQAYNLQPGRFDQTDATALSRVDLEGQNPNQLFMISGLAREVSHLKRRDHPRNHIYLDGACRGPYVSMGRGILSLDHHEDCIRAITLATCIQSLRLARRRAIAATGFNIAGNDPDLDTVFGAWSLIHADRLAFDDRAYKKIRPIVNVVGTVDAYGFGCDDFTDLGTDELAAVKHKIAWFIKEELDAKRSGRWKKMDFLEYTGRKFEDIDRYAFYTEDAEELVTIDSHEEFTLPGGDTIMFVQAQAGGVYGAENELVNKKRGSKCVCVIYFDGRGKWTIKLTGILSKYNLNPLCKRLSDLELQQKHRHGVTNEALLKTRWGGSNTIIGEPRYEGGIAPFLSKEAIVGVVKEELHKQSVKNN